MDGAAPKLGCQGGVRSHGFFPLSEGRAPEDGARRLHGPGGLSQRAPLLRGARGRGRALDDPAHHGGDEAGGAGGGLVEPLPSRARMGCRLEQSGIRPARRDHGPLAHRIRGLQLLRPRHRQHGGARALRHARAAGALARTPPRRPHPLGLRHDRAARRLLGCHQHLRAHRARRRGLCLERPQMVVLGGRQQGLRDPHLHGQDRAGGSTPQAAVDDPGAPCRPRGRDRSPPRGLRLRPRPPRSLGGQVHQRARARGQHAARRGARLRDRARALWDPAASTTACASSAWPSARSRRCAARARARRLRQAARRARGGGAT